MQLVSLTFIRWIVIYPVDSAIQRLNNRGQISKIHTRFQTWPLGRNYVMITYIRAQTKNFYKLFSNSHISISFLFFGIETINTFIHSRSSVENHPRFQTKISKVYTRFQTKKAQKPYLLGRHIAI